MMRSRNSRRKPACRRRGAPARRPRSAPSPTPLPARIPSARCGCRAHSQAGTFCCVAGGQAAVAQIGPRLRAVGRLQLVLEELRRHLHHVDQAGALLLALFRPARRAPASARRPCRRSARTASGKLTPSSRSGTGNGRRKRRSRNNGSGPSCPRSGSSAISRHGTGSRPSSRRATRWSSSCPTRRAGRSPIEIGTRSRISSRKEFEKRMADGDPSS